MDIQPSIEWMKHKAVNCDTISDLTLMISNHMLQQTRMSSASVFLL